MQYLDLKKRLKDFLIFSIKDIEKLNLSFYKQRLSEWQSKGYIKKICQGFYVFSDLEINEKDMFIIANKIYEPSYVSLETALSFYGLIPETVYSVTSVTSRNTKDKKTLIGTFIYKRIKSSFMFGYDLEKHNGFNYRIAEMEKAILDYLYLNAKINNRESFDETRFNVTELISRLDVEKFNKYLEAFNNKALARRAKKFLTYIQNYD